MNTGITLSRPTRWLIAANAVLALTVSAELLFPAQPGTANAAAATEAASSLPEFGDATVAAPPIGQLVDMLERPLFFVDRRMPQPEVETAAAPPPTPLRLKLEGIAIAGGARVAVLRNLNGNGLLQLVEHRNVQPQRGAAHRTPARPRRQRPAALERPAPPDRSDRRNYSLCG